MDGNHLKYKHLIYLIVFVEVFAFILAGCAFILDAPSINYYVASMALLILAICIYFVYETSEGKAIFLNCLVGFLILYGFFSFMFPIHFASKVFPSNWQWPLAGKMQALVLKSGQKAVVLEGALRVQIYDANNKYLRGWFVPVISSGNTPKLIGNAEERFGPKGQEMILVEVYRDAREYYFTPEGQIALVLPIDRSYFDRPKTGTFETISSWSSWYTLPFCDPIYAWCCVMAGLLGAVILSQVGLLCGGDNSKADEG